MTSVERPVELRPATMADAERLLAWRNDPDTRRQSIHGDEVGRDDHLSWLTRTLQSPTCRLDIAMVDDDTIGTVRADRGEDGIEISITVAPEHRGRRLAAPLIRAVATAARRRWPDMPIIARIKAGNDVSIRAFERAGFTPTGGDERGLLVWRWSEKAADPTHAERSGVNVNR